MTIDPIELDADAIALLDAAAGPVEPLTVNEADPDPELGFSLVEGKNGGTLQRLTDDENGRARAAALQEKSRGKYREARQLRAQRSSEEASEILDTVKDALTLSADGGRPTSIPKMSDDIVRMMGGLIRNGGPMFAPTSAKEASDIAKQWASIGASYRTGRAMDKVTETIGTPVGDPASEVLKAMAEQATRLRMNAAARGAQPGQVRQILDADDDMLGG
jgi:hypothetical protein